MTHLTDEKSPAEVTSSKAEEGPSSSSLPNAFLKIGHGRIGRSLGLLALTGASFFQTDPGKRTSITDRIRTGPSVDDIRKLLASPIEFSQLVETSPKIAFAFLRADPGSEVALKSCLKWSEEHPEEVVPLLGYVEALPYEIRTKILEKTLSAFFRDGAFFEHTVLALEHLHALQRVAGEDRVLQAIQHSKDVLRYFDTSDEDRDLSLSEDVATLIFLRARELKNSERGLKILTAAVQDFVRYPKPVSALPLLMQWKQIFPLNKVDENKIRQSAVPLAMTRYPWLEVVMPDAFHEKGTLPDRDSSVSEKVWNEKMLANRSLLDEILKLTNFLEITEGGRQLLLFAVDRSLKENPDLVLRYFPSLVKANVVEGRLFYRIIDSYPCSELLITEALNLYPLWRGDRREDEILRRLVTQSPHGVINFVFARKKTSSLNLFLEKKIGRLLDGRAEDILPSTSLFALPLFETGQSIVASKADDFVAKHPLLFGSIYVNKSDEEEREGALRQLRMVQSTTLAAFFCIYDQPFLKGIDDKHSFTMFLPAILAGKVTMADLARFSSDRCSQFLRAHQLYRHWPENPNREEYRDALDDLAERAVREINDRHALPDEKRFAPLKDYGAADLYALLVNGAEELYTSSFYGIFDRFLTRLRDEGGGTEALFSSQDSRLLNQMIGVTSEFGRIEEFLSIFPPSRREEILRQYIERLEERVDPAEGLMGIADALIQLEGKPEIRGVLTSIIRSESDRCHRDSKSIGITLYEILLEFAQKPSLDTTSFLQLLGTRNGLDSLFHFDPRSLLDASRVNTQVYRFYSDDDGIASFSHFESFHSAGRGWMREDRGDWVVFSTKRNGKSVKVYANKPNSSFSTLSAHLATNNISPTIFVHRGHSYHAEDSLRDIPSGVKLVFFGSCGGYRLMAEILEKSPDAQVISTRSTGKMGINDPVMDVITQRLLDSDEGIPWNHLWRLVERAVPDKEGFRSYVPPSQNVAAIAAKLQLTRRAEVGR